MTNVPRPFDEKSQSTSPPLPELSGYVHRPPSTPHDAFHDATTTVNELRQLMRDFVAERQWEKFHNAKNLSMSLAIEAGELMEHFQWLTTEQVVAGEGFELAQVADELADVTCYALSLANALGLDLSSSIASKMIKNRLKYPAEMKPEASDMKSET